MADKDEVDPYMAVGEEEVNRLIRENNHIFTDTQCKVCSAVLISDSQKHAHYQSKKHANKVRRYMSLLNEGDPSAPKKIKVDRTARDSSSNGAEDRNKCCPICNMSFSAPVVAASHYEGKTHAKNLRLKEQGPTAPGMARVPTTTSSPASDLNDPEKFCRLCSAPFNNPLMAQQHYSGKKHKKNETKNQLLGQMQAPSSTPSATRTIPSALLASAQFSCDDCKVTLNSVEQYQSHIAGVKHKTIVQIKTMGGDKYSEDPQPSSRQNQKPSRFENSYNPEGTRGDGRSFYSNDY